MPSKTTKEYIRYYAYLRLSIFSDALPYEMISLVSEYVCLSPLLNPYEDKTAIMRWADSMYYQRKLRSGAKSKNNFSSSKVFILPVDKQLVYRTLRVEDQVTLNKEPLYYKDIKNSALEPQIPVWDISMLELRDLYHSVRLHAYFDYESPVYAPSSSACVSKPIKRLIPWLFPQDGKLY